MIRPDPQTTKALARAVQGTPELVEWLKEILTRELDRLPFVPNNVAVYQGRCQTLMELIEFLEQVPDIAAKL